MDSSNKYRRIFSVIIWIVLSAFWAWKGLTSFATFSTGEMFRVWLSMINSDHLFLQKMTTLSDQILSVFGHLAITAMFSVPLLAWNKNSRPVAWFFLVLLEIMNYLLKGPTLLGVFRLIAVFTLLENHWLSAKKTENGQNILFFDGVCNLCNGFIDFLIRKDKAGLLKFAPLQSQIAQQKLSSELTQKLPSVVLLQGNVQLTESRAVLESLQLLGGIWRFVGMVFSVVPSFLADPIYRLFASQRYALFGKRDTCRLPTSEEKSRFL